MRPRPRPHSILVAAVVLLLALSVALAPGASAGGPADLHVTIADNVDPVTAGAQVTYTVTLLVTNFPSNTQVTIELDSTTTFVSLTEPPDAECIEPTVGTTGTVTCTYELTPGGADIYQVTVLTTTHKTISAVATASHDLDPDATPSDNTDTETTLVRPANDHFANATVLVGETGSVDGNNDEFTGEFGEPNHDSLADPFESAWYAWTAPAAGLATFDLCALDFPESILAVYTGSAVDALAEVVADDGCVASTGVSFSASSATTYHVAVDGYETNSGPFVLSWSLTDIRPPNDDFANAEVITGPSGNAEGTNLNATGETGEPENAPDSDPIQSVWYAWTAPATGTATFDVCTSGVDTTLAGYTGPAVDELTQVASGDDDCGSSLFQSEIEFNAVGGTTYRISVDGFGADSGSFTLAWDLFVPPPEDEADLVLTKMASKSVVAVGEAFTYGLQVANSGPDMATGVTLVDTLPPEVSFSSVTPSQGTCEHDAGVVTCDLGTIRATTRARVMIRVVAETAGTATNNAVATANEDDPTSPNEASAETTINAAPNGGNMTLTVQRLGGGRGSVASQPAGISCGRDCTEEYADGATVVLRARPRSGVTFDGWGGDCASAGTNPTCTLTMDADKTVTATFT